MKTVAQPHVSICVCTYKRAHLLPQVLSTLAKQETGDLFTYSIVIVDNDELQSASEVIRSFQASAPVPVSYVVEPRRNIALARNKAVESAEGDFLAFIDDDELAPQHWLLALFRTCLQHGADGALGPVRPQYQQPPAQWIVKGRFHERPTYPTGFVIDWRKGRTGNTLLKKNVFNGLRMPFRPEFITGEDQDFFRRMIEAGYSFVWCNEAVAYELVTELRCRRGHMLKRALLRGRVSIAHQTSRPWEILKSLVAVPLYIVALPFLLLIGQHHFMRYLIKLTDHTGRLLAASGFAIGEGHYVDESVESRTIA